MVNRKRANRPGEQENSPSDDASTNEAARIESPTPTANGEDAPAAPPQFVVGIGASAGGLASIEAFFHSMPRHGRLAFVLVQHLSPDHPSLMAEIMVKHTSMRVEQAEHGAPLRADTLHLIPPNKVLRVTDGRIELSQRVEHQLHFPIDAFFRSLAEEYGPRAIAVILSGTGTDGTNGLREINQAGGTVLVQDDTAQFDGMPRSAISTGMADFILPPGEIATKILELTRQEMPTPMIDASAWDDTTFEDVLTAVRRVTGNDFRGYREKTIRRRIEKRMLARQETSPRKYAKLLAGDRREVESLANELLIGVTSMFRDPEAFDSVKREILPNLLEDGVNLRIWVVGCSTGEEAYSLAILIDEYIRHHRIRANYRIFATDIDDRAIQRAGVGVFSVQALRAVDTQLLQRCFSREGDGYRIVTRIRERIVFAKHDVIKDPPFTKVDLITCRNLLIYQLAELQTRTLGMLQFALREKGYLWLGPSESLGARENAFSVVDKRWRLFRRTDHMVGEHPFRQADGTAVTTRRSLAERQVHRQEALLLGKVCSALMHGEDQAAVVVSESDTILYVFGKTAPFFAIPEGRPTQLVATALVQPVGNTVAGLLRKARRDRMDAIAGRTTVKDADGRSRGVNVTVRKVETQSNDSIAIIVLGFDTSNARILQTHDVDSAEVNERITELESELGEAQSTLQMTIEELESSNEELQSANEELLASNEELQSTNEELHSVNEELHTVNAEYQRKLAEQHMLTADMEHLLQTTDVGTIFLDSRFCVRRYTPAITRVIPLLPSDQGRPIGHIKHLMLDVDLEEIAQRTKDEQRLEEQVQTTDNHSYELRAVPYNDYGDHVDGVVMTLFDVTALENERRKAQEGEHRFEQVVANIDEVIWIRNRETGAFSYLSPVAESLWGRQITDLIEHPDLWLYSIHEDDRERVRLGYERGLKRGVIQMEYRICLPDGQVRWMRDRGFPIIDQADQQLERLAGVTMDITAAKQTEDELRDHAVQMSRLALNDALTGLANRRGFEKQLDDEVKRAKRNGDLLAAVLVDCDNFKQINDELGHNAGDDVLREIATRLNRSLRPNDVLARIGGDEFVALLPSTRNAEALRVAERMRRTICDTPVFAASQDIRVTVSIGVDTIRTDSVSTATVLSDLHHGLARSKEHGKNRVTDGRGDGVSVEHPDQLRSMLRNEKAIRVVAQAIRKISDGSVVGYELLSRGPAGDYETPDALFQLANDFDMLTVVDAHCLRGCLRAAAQLRERHRDMRIHLNAFPATLLNGSSQELRAAFEELGDLDGICLEISEQQVVGEPTYLRDGLSELRNIGLKIAIDDVGFGRSSLESLILLEPEVIKVDRSFVRGIHEEPARRRSLDRLLSVSRGLDTEVVAEGIETEGDSRVLSDLGVQLGQGFLWDHPAPLDSLN